MKDQKTTLLGMALQLNSLGMNIVPVCPEWNLHRQKFLKPPAKRFPLKVHFETRQSRAVARAIVRGYRKGTSLGVILGRVSAPEGFCLVVLDFDSRRLFKRFRRALSEIIDATWVVRTPRGFHVYLLLPESLALASTALDFGPEGRIDILADHHYVVAGGSTEPALGLAYTYVNRPERPLILHSLDPLRCLYAAAGKPLRMATSPSLSSEPTRKPTSPSPVWQSIAPDQISHKTYALIVDNAYVRYGYPSRSEADMASFRELVSKGFSLEQISDFFRAEGHAQSKFRDHAKPDQYFATTYRSAQRYASGLTVSDDPHTIESLDVTAWALTTLSQTPWRLHSTDLRVLWILLDLARHLGCISFRISCRDLAERSNTSAATSHRCLRRLSKRGFLTVGVGKGSVATRVTLTLPSSIPESSPHAHTSSLSMCSPDHDIWQNGNGGLGSSGWDLFRTLQRAPDGLTARQLADQIAIPRSTIYYLRKRMLNLQLITERGATLFAVPDPDLDDIAVTAGIWSRRTTLVKRHLLERTAYRDWFEERRHGASSANPSFDIRAPQDASCHLCRARRTLALPAQRSKILVRHHKTRSGERTGGTNVRSAQIRQCDTPLIRLVRDARVLSIRCFAPLADPVILLNVRGPPASLARSHDAGFGGKLAS